MNVLIACEWSGTVRDTFIARGHNAWSCDLLPGEGHSVHRHFQASIIDVLDPIYGYEKNGVIRYPIYWDMLIAFPPCTHLCSSGARWFKDKQAEQAEALDFVRILMDQPIARICIENPIGVISSKIRKPDQIIQPWQFGHGETKATCLWLKGLPPLKPTNIVDGREERVHRMAPGPNRSKERGKTYTGIARAMAEQWG